MKTFQQISYLYHICDFEHIPSVSWQEIAEEISYLYSYICKAENSKLEIYLNFFRIQMMTCTI